MVGISANLLPDERHLRSFSRKSPIGTTLVKEVAGPTGQGPEVRKGRLKMSGSKFQSHLIAVFASLLMSTIAVGAAVTPAQVSAAPVEVVTYA
jgi:hypothetical protein